jgi:hypothetical protein
MRLSIHDYENYVLLGYIGGIYSRNNTPRCLWDKCELQQQHWEVEGQLVEAFTKWSSVNACPSSFCAVFSKMAITPRSEVEKMCCLLGSNLDFKTLLVMYHLAHVYSQDGTDLGVKLMLLSRNIESFLRNPS